MASDRDLRIDVVRGLALLVIFSDHIPGNAVRRYTLLALGGADFSEVFVFVSGYVCGMSYGRVLARRGLLACQQKAAWRAVQIYAALALTVTVICALSWAMERAGAGFSNPLRSTLLPLLGDGPGHVLKEVLTMQAGVGNLGILKLYVVLLAVLPLVLQLMSVSRTAALALSLALYTVVQAAPGAVPLPQAWSRMFSFDPIAWQLLFFIAVALGAGRPATNSDAAGIYRRWWLIAIAFVLVELVVAWNLAWPGRDLPWAGKRLLEPLRLVHFAALAVLFVGVTERRSPIWTCFPFPLIRLCGRHSLAVFCCGVVLSQYVTWLLLVYGYSALHQLAANVVGWTLCVAVAWMASRVVGREARPVERRCERAVPGGALEQL